MIFIDVVDQSGRKSGFNLKAGRGARTLAVRGVLPHNSDIRPATAEDARALMRWAKQWETELRSKEGRS